MACHFSLLCKSWWWVAAAQALAPSENRDALLAGLSDGDSLGTFHLDGCTAEEFDVLCKSMVALGGAVRKVVSDGYWEYGGFAFFDAGTFLAALRTCPGLVTLRCVGA